MEGRNVSCLLGFGGGGGHLMSIIPSPLNNSGNNIMPPSQPNTLNEDYDSNTIKAKIMSHPHYPRLLSAYINCQKVGAPPEVVARLEEACSSSFMIGKASSSSSSNLDPSLDQFMEAYCEMLIKYEQELSKPFKEAMLFLSHIDAQFKSVSLNPGIMYDKEKSTASTSSTSSKKRKRRSHKKKRKRVAIWSDSDASSTSCGEEEDVHGASNLCIMGIGEKKKKNNKEKNYNKFWGYSDDSSSEEEQVLCLTGLEQAKDNKVNSCSSNSSSSDSECENASSFDLANTYNEMFIEFKKYVVRIKDLKKENSTLQEKLDLSSKKCDELAFENKNLNMEIENMNVEKQIVGDRLNEYSLENNKLKARISLSTSIDKEINECKIRIDNLQKEIENMKVINTKLVEKSKVSHDTTSLVNNNFFCSQ